MGESHGFIRAVDNPCQLQVKRDREQLRPGKPIGSRKPATGEAASGLVRQGPEGEVMKETYRTFFGFEREPSLRSRAKGHP